MKISITILLAFFCVSAHAGVFEKLGANDVLVSRKFAKKLSIKLKANAILIGIYDGDSWWYEFYNNGKNLYEFSSVPDYWKKLSKKERKSLRGNPKIIEDNWKFRILILR